MVERTHNIFQKSFRTKPLLWIYLLMGIVAVAIVGSMGYIYYIGQSMVANHAPLIDAAMEIKLEATTAHLWFEEIISGDRNESIDTVLKHLDNADWYVQAMLEGGENVEGKFVPLRDTHMRQEITSVRSKLMEFRKITQERWETGKTAGVGTEIDQKYDAIFKDFIGQADRVETELQKLIKQQFIGFRIVQIVLAAICLLVTVVVGISFNNFVLRQIKDELQLQAVNQQLNAANQQLQKEIAERKRAEKMREELVTSLEDTNAELERFNHTVSHDLKSPLITINGFLETLEKNALAGEKEKLKDDIAHISNATKKMHELLDDLLEVFRIGHVPSKCEEISLVELAEEAVKLSLGSKVGQEIEVIISPDLPVVCGERPRLFEVMRNLIDNAAKFTDNQSAPVIEIGYRKDEDQTVYYVRDNGIGIEVGNHQKIFSLFDQLDKKYPGMGAGLSLVKRIIEVYKGRIWVESEGAGCGSTFCFTIPFTKVQQDNAK